MIRVKAPAKINLFLEVTGRRPDGYHNLATIFARVGICDRLSFRRGRAPGIKLSVKDHAGLGIKNLTDNLVYEAAVNFFRAFALFPAVSITLHKFLPVGAGLGGGSSDAAATLLGLCRLYRLSPKANAAKLRRLAQDLGADVPFFLLDSPLASATGRGEKLKLLAPRGKMPDVVLVYPGRPVYTKEAFGRLRPAPEAAIRARLKNFRELIGAVQTGDFTSSRAGLLFNRLEEVVLPEHQAVRLAKTRLERAGADMVLMSGSGASVFALCWRRGQARRVAAAVACNRNYRVFLTNFC